MANPFGDSTSFSPSLDSAANPFAVRLAAWVVCVCVCLCPVAAAVSAAMAACVAAMCVLGVWIVLVRGCRLLCGVGVVALPVALHCTCRLCD